MVLEGYLLCFRLVWHWKVLEIWDVTGVGKAECPMVWDTLFDRTLELFLSMMVGLPSKTAWYALVQLEM